MPVWQLCCSVYVKYVPALWIYNKNTAMEPREATQMLRSAIHASTYSASVSGDGCATASVNH